jgi:hypothetical protein
METIYTAAASSRICFLLPIREAYEWKHQTRFHPVCAVVERNILLPIREAYEWKQCLPPIRPHQTKKEKTTCFQFVKRMNGNFAAPDYLLLEPFDLLPIREAYEWKPVRAKLFSCGRQNPCFQFVKRMNGNNV